MRSTAAPAAGHRRRHPPDRLHALASRPLARRRSRCRPCARRRRRSWGLASRRPSRPASEFTPDRELADGEVLPCRAAASAQPARHPHAGPRRQPPVPGAGGGRPAVLGRPHPERQHHGRRPARRRHDGLPRFARPADRRLREFGIDFILPAHGHVLGFRAECHRAPEEAPPAARSQGHRRHARQARRTLEDWVPLAYADVPPRMWPVAQRSLLAHVQRIEALGLAPARG
jgi:recombination protein RecT